jgi:uncharacterized protein YndB with AHSA1/START domain
MEKTTKKSIITVTAKVHASIEKVWNYWTNPHHIMHWNAASEDWHTTWAKNNLRLGGQFASRMEARDGSQGFEFSGKYSNVVLLKLLAYKLDDGREVTVLFSSDGENTGITENFEAETTFSLELQQQGWQSILNNFKKYVETNSFEHLHFEVSINGRVNEVFDAMFEKRNWKEWTAAFNPSSYFEGSWEKGKKIRFLGEDNDGKTGGMTGLVKENIKGRFVSIEYLGIVEGDKEKFEGEGKENWAGALENYTFSETNGITLVEVDMDSNKEFKHYFINTWPKALDKLKKICER